MRWTSWCRRQARQMGVRCPGGAEKIAMLVRAAVKVGVPMAIVDLANAYNSVSRDAVLASVRRHAPSLLPYLRDGDVYAAAPPRCGWRGIFGSPTGRTAGRSAVPAARALVLHDVVERTRAALRE